MSFFKKNSPYIIAEIASAHEGNPDLAIELLNLASKSNADAIKFQIFKTEKLLSIQNPHYKEFKEINFNEISNTIEFSNLIKTVYLLDH